MLTRRHSVYFSPALLVLALVVSQQTAAFGQTPGPFDTAFVHKYAEANRSSSGAAYFSFPNARERLNAFNRSLSLTIPIGPRYHLGGSFSYQFNLQYGSDIWDYTERWDGGNPDPYLAFEPAKRSKAGVGWSLDFGRMLGPGDNPFGQYTYVSPDGEIHRFYGSGGTYYSRTELKLRLRVSGTTASVDFLTGVTKIFSLADGEWTFSEMRDQFGNWIRRAQPSSSLVTYADSAGRITNVYILTSGDKQGMIWKIELPGSSALSTPAFRDTYTLNYSVHAHQAPAADSDPATPASWDLVLLNKVNMPEGRFVQVAYGAAGQVGAARPSLYRNEFGGESRFEWEEIPMPYVADPENPGVTMDHFAADVIGVKRRWTTAVDGSEGGEWTFSSIFTPWGTTRLAPPAAVDDGPRGFNSYMTSPGGNVEEYRFRVSMSDFVPPGWSHTIYKAEYGSLGDPNANSIAVVWAIKDKNLNYQDVRRNRRQLSWTNSVDTGRVVTKVYRRNNQAAYRYDQDFSSFVWSGEPQVTVEKDVGANLRADDRQTVLTFSSLTMPGASQLWVRMPASKIEISEAGVSSVLYQCANALGQVTRRRWVRGSGLAANDFIEEYKYDQRGNPAGVRYFGGDGANNLPLGSSLCSLQLPEPEFETYKTYTATGVLVADGFLDANGNPFGAPYYATGDSAGKTVSSRRGTGPTKYMVYDGLGRLTAETWSPGVGPRIEHYHVDAGEGTNLNLTSIHTTFTGDRSEILGQTSQKFDGFGLLESSSRRWNGGWATTTNVYDAEGNLLEHNLPGGGGVLYGDFDYQGRPGVVTQIDAPSYPEQYSYSGNYDATSTTTVVDKSVSPPAERSRVATLFSNRNGDLVGYEWTDSGGSSGSRWAKYDLWGHRVQVGDATQVETSPNQYDRTGLLTRDRYGLQHQYNSRRQALEEYSRYGEMLGVVYDRAGRVTSLVATQSYTGVILGSEYLAFEYGTDGNLKSTTRRHFNQARVLGGTAEVVDNFEYNGSLGSVSERETQIFQDGLLVMSYTTRASYNDDGRLQSVQLPTCLGSASFSCSVAPGSTLDLEYAYDLLKEVTLNSGTSLFNAVSFDHSGRVYEYRSGNNLRTLLSYNGGLKTPFRVYVADDQNRKKFNTMDWAGPLKDSSPLASADSHALAFGIGPLTLPSKPAGYQVDPLGMAYRYYEGFTKSCPHQFCNWDYVYDAFGNLIWSDKRPNLYHQSTMVWRDISGNPAAEVGVANCTASLGCPAGTYRIETISESFQVDGVELARREGPWIFYYVHSNLLGAAFVDSDANQTMSNNVFN